MSTQSSYQNVGRQTTAKFVIPKYGNKHIEYTNNRYVLSLFYFSFKFLSFDEKINQRRLWNVLVDHDHSFQHR